MTNPSPEQVEAARKAYAAHGGVIGDEYREFVCPECGWSLAAEDERRTGEANAELVERSENHRFSAALLAAAGAPVSGSTSDGYHTFDELYDYRMLYNAHAAHGWLAAGIPVVKSWKHSDGEPCFGGGWFIVTATLPTGQVSNHYKAEHWALFQVPEVELPPEYDGHTPHVAAERLRAAAGAAPHPEPDKPADLSIMNGWLVESVSRHTCGAGMDGYGHEPGCGYMPVLNLAELDGYPKQTAEAVERVSALHRMVLRGNSMRGEELKSWCKHCDTAYPCETMLALEIELVCECYGADGVTDPKCPACAAPAPQPDTEQTERVAARLREVVYLCGDDLGCQCDEAQEASVGLARELSIIAAGAPAFTAGKVWALAQALHDDAGDSDNVSAFVCSLTDALRTAGIAFDEPPFIEGGYLRPALAAPVVDESKLAEVISETDPMVRTWINLDDLGRESARIARAVAEWLRGDAS